MTHSMLGRASADFRVNGDRHSRGNVSFRSLLRGRWHHTLCAPVRVSDPDLLNLCFHLLPREKVLLRERHIITEKTANRLVRHGDRIRWRLLERLLSGGGTKWVEEYFNIVVNEGLDHLLDVVLSGGTQDTSWFVGLLAASPSPAAGWTATEIAGADFVAYDEANLQAFTDGGVSGQSVDNSGSTADFSINSDSSSIGGAYLIGTNAKAVPAGTLYAAGAFSGGNKAADNGDTLSVTATFTSADDGV